MRPPRARRSLSNGTTSTRPPAPISASSAARERAALVLAPDDAVDGRPPRGLARPGGAVAQQRVDERERRADGTCRPGPAANASPDEPLQPGQGRAELGEVALDERGQQRGQHELGDQRRALGVGPQVGERLLLGAAREPRLGRRDREHAAPLVRHRVARRAAVRGRRSRGAGRPRRRTRRARTSTGRRPSARRGRPCAPSPPGRATGRRAAPAPRRRRARASCPDPRPDVRRDRLDHLQPGGGRAGPSAARQRSATASARSASGPSAVSSSAVRRLDAPPPGGTRRRRARRTAARPRRRRRACPCAAARAPRRGRSSSVAGAARTWRQDAVHRRALARAGRLVDRDARRASSARISPAGSRRAREARIEASSTAAAARLEPMNSRPTPRATTRVVTRARGPRRLDRVDGDLAPRAGVGQHGAIDGGGRPGRRVRVVERGLA